MKTPNLTPVIPIVPPVGHAPQSVTRVTLKIDRSDLRKMDYYLNECPMANPAVQNAVAKRLREIIRSNLEVSVVSDNGRAIAHIGDETIDLGPDIGSWLESVYMGLLAQPKIFEIEIPARLVNSRARAASLPTKKKTDTPLRKAV